MNKLLLYIKILINFLFVVAAALFVLLILPRIIRFFMPFVIGLIVSMIANPLVKFLEKRVKLLRKHSSVIIMVTVIAAIIGVAYLLFSLLFREIRGLSEDLPNIIESVGNQFSELSDTIQKFSETLPVSLQNMITKMLNGIRNYASEFTNNLQLPTMSTAGNLVKDIAEGFLMAIVIVLSSYFFTAYRDELVAGLKKHMPQTVTEYWRLITDNFKAAFGGYFKAQFKIMLVLTIIMFIGFEILQVGYSFVIALGIAFLDLLPVFGTGAILWPWAIIDMISGNYFRAIGLVIIYIICQVVKQVLQPKMVGDSIGLHPIATLVFLFVGYQLYGMLGMIIGIPVGMVIVNLYRVGMFDRLIRGFKIIVNDINEFRKF